MKEYKVISLKLNGAEAKMNEMSKEGWQVVTTTLDFGRFSFQNYIIITFSRDK